MTVQQAFELAVQNHQSGRLAEAEAIYRQILAVEPRHADALNLLGVIAHQNGRNEVAVDLIRQAIALAPGNPDFYCNLGATFRALGTLDEAVLACRRAIDLKPDFPEARYNLGIALYEKGRLDEAIIAYREAIALKHNYPDAHYNLGIALYDMGKIPEAIAAYRQAIALQPGRPEAHNNLGTALSKNGQLEEAIIACRRAITLKPIFPEAHYNLGIALYGAGQLDEAIAAHGQAIALRPDYPEAHSNLGAALGETGRLDEVIAAYGRAIALKPDFPDAHSNLLLTLNYHPGFDARAIAEEHRRWNRQHAEPLRQFIQPHCNDRTPDRRLRIGYVSPDFREHPVGRFLLPLLARHDHQNFEIFSYAQVPVPDSVTGQLRAHSDHWHTLTGLSDWRAAELIRHHRIDILVDLSGHTSRNRLLVFAHKPAPIQVTWLGYPNTTGLAAMDYRLTDAWADPPGLNESCYSERLLRLAPCAWCYQQTHSPEIAVRREGPITFGCFNTLAKVTEPMLALWARILGAVPGSRLLLKARGLGGESTRKRVRQILERAGIGPERAELRGHEPAQDAHLALYNRLDIALDTFPYHGTTTTCEALWMGVPVVTMAGKTHASRVGVSLLSNVGLPEFVAASAEECMQLAVSLGNDLPRLAGLRSTLRDRMRQSPLMDAPRFARDIESAYREMWRQWCVSESRGSDRECRT